MTPPSIRPLVRNLPHVPSAAVVATALDLLLRRRLSRLAFYRLGERRFAVSVPGMGLDMAFRRRGRRFVPVAGGPGATALRVRLETGALDTLAAPPGSPPGDLLRAISVAGDPVVAHELREAIAALDVDHARRLLRRAARWARREAAPH